MDIMRTKTVEQAVRDTEEPEFRLKKTLESMDLVLFGIGSVIGSGIFVLTGQAAAHYAGPAISLSFVVAGVACLLAALCYAEFSSVVPVAGSAYTFSYASLGEFLAWIIGWDLLLELSLIAATVAVGWSGYLAQILEGFFGITLPASLTSATEGFVNLPATLIALLMTAVLVIGIRFGSWVNLVVTAMKLSVILFFIGFGAFFVDTANFVPFVPSAAAPQVDQSGLEAPLLQAFLGIEQQSFGFSGIISGAAIVFFAYIGFDTVTSAAEEARNPQRTLPLALIGSLLVCVLLYVLVSQILTGILPYDLLDTPAPMAEAFAEMGQGWAAGLVSLGAVAGLTSGIMIFMFGQSRVVFAMSRDHLLPSYFVRPHLRFHTPYRAIVLTGLVVAILAAFCSIKTLSALVNIGTLFAFILVAIGVVTLRRTAPDLRRAFRTPLVPLIPILTILVCLYLMVSLPGITWIRFFVWMMLGIVVYFLYSVHSSRLCKSEAKDGIEGEKAH
jgi:basic amino acid/polyamine antiporter, APA family